MAVRSCDYCGSSEGEINFDIFTEKYFCDKDECIKKARKDTKEYFKQREIKINKDFNINDISSQEDFENMLYALYGLLDKSGKTKEFGALKEPDFFKNKAMYLIASEIPEEYVSIKMGDKDRTKVRLIIKKRIPKEIIKKAMQKAKFID
jgi:hypothetical protein